MGATPKIDWEQAFDAWILVIKPKGELTQATYAKQLGVQETHLSRRFAEIKRERTMAAINSKMPQVMRKSLKQVDEALDATQVQNDKGDWIDVDPMAKGKLALDIFAKLADRQGMSPQANLITIQQNTQTNTFIIQPMFHSEQNQEETKLLFNAELDEQ